MNNLKSGGTLFLAYKGKMGRASVTYITRGGAQKGKFVQSKK